MPRSQLQDSDLNGRPIFVREDREAGGAPAFAAARAPAGRGAPAAAVASAGCKVHIGNLSWDVTWQAREQRHSRAPSPPLPCRAPRHALPPSPPASRGRTSRRARGVAPGTWRCAGHVALRVLLSRAPACAAASYQRRVCCAWQELKDLCKSAGTVLRADVAAVRRDPPSLPPHPPLLSATCPLRGTGTTVTQLPHFAQGADCRSKGHGTATFASTKEAAKAIQLFHEAEFKGRVLSVTPDAYA